MLTRELIRPSLHHRSLVIGALIGMLVGMIALFTLDHIFAPDPNASPTPNVAREAESEGLRADPYHGPVEVLGCLYAGDRCVQLWLPYDSIEGIMEFSRIPPYGSCMRGRLYFRSFDGLCWEERVFLLPLGYPR